MVRPRRETEFASVSTASTCKATPFDMVPAINFPRYISSSCSADQQWADRVAWAESSLLAHAMSGLFRGEYVHYVNNLQVNGDRRVIIRERLTCELPILSGHCRIPKHYSYLGPTRLNLSSSEYKSEYLPRLESMFQLQKLDGPHPLHARCRSLETD